MTLTPTPNSAFQLAGLIEGKFDIAHTAIDNVVAYTEGQGEAAVFVKPDLVAFMGGDNGFLALVTQPEIKGYGDLKGKTLSVDAMTTGYCPATTHLSAPVARWSAGRRCNRRSTLAPC